MRKDSPGPGKKGASAAPPPFLLGLLDSTNLVIYLKDIEGRYLYVNKRYESLSGVPREALIGKRDHDFFPPEVADLFRSQDAQVARHGSPIQFEETIPLPGGEYSFITEKFPLFDEQGAVYAVGGFCTEITPQKKQSESELRWKSILLEAQANSTHEGLLIVDSKGHKILQNQRLTELLRIPARIAEDKDDTAQLSFVTSLTKHPEKFLEKVKALYSRPDETSQDEVELRDGTILDRYSAPVVGRDGENLGRIWRFRDITEKKRAEEKSLRDRELLATTERIAGIGGWEFTVEGMRLTWSREVFRIHELEDDRAPAAETAIGFYVPEHVPAITKAVEEALGTGKSFDLEVGLITARGNRREVHVRGVADSRNGKVHRISGTLQDITERKRTEAALLRARGMSETILNSIDDHILIIDRRDYRIVDANKAFLDDYGVTLDEVRGRTCHEMTHGRSSACNGPSDPCPIAAMIESGLPATIDHLHRTPKGDERIHAVAVHPIKKSNGEIEHIVHISRDITEYRQREQQLFNMQRLESLGILAGGIAHDFNNVLTAIQGNISMVQNSVKADREVLEMIEDALSACETAKGLSHQLLTFSKGGRPIVKIANLLPVLKQAANFAARGSNARCVFDLRKAPLAAVIDKDQVAQVIQNLVINAIQAMPNGGDITFRAARVKVKADDIASLDAGLYIRVDIKDEGIGISPANLSRVFDPYYSTKAVGRGLGLSMCYSIMKKHGGHIAVESAPDEGTTFSLYFPTPSNAKLPAEGRKPVIKTGSGRVLIMDDESVVIKILTRILTRLGYQVTGVSDGRSAIESYKQALTAGRPYDAIILDLTVPGGIGGKQTLAEISALDPKVKAVVSSGYSNDQVLADYAAAGFRGVLSKPYRVEDVSETLHRVIRSKAG